MKTLNITFTDAEYKRLLKAKRLYCEKRKGNVSWHLFILRVCAKNVSVWKNLNKNKNKNEFKN